MSEPTSRSGSALQAIQAIDYTAILVRDMAAMRRFYEEVLGLALIRELSANWIEYRLGPNILALARHHPLIKADTRLAQGNAQVQLAFRVTPDEVDACAEELTAKGVTLLAPPTSHAFGHRTVFFRDPDGNLLEIYAEI